MFSLGLPREAEPFTRHFSACQPAVRRPANRTGFERAGNDQNLRGIKIEFSFRAICLPLNLNKSNGFVQT
jgi:hypothetical protein